MVTDERISSLGLETGFSINTTKRVTIDMTYFPPSDAARCKVLLRQGKVKLSGTWQAPSVKSLSTEVLQQVKYDFETKLSPMETLKLAFDSKSKAAKVKYGRKLDSKNKVDMEYAYAGANVPTGRPVAAVTLKLSHSHSPKHSFSAAFNYGTKKIAAEWEWKTDKGPWTVNAAFPFNARYVCFFVFLFVLVSRLHFVFVMFTDVIVIVILCVCVFAARKVAICRLSAALSFKT